MTQKTASGLETDELLALVKFNIDKGEIENALYKIKDLLVDKKPPAEVHAIAARVYAQLGLFERAKDQFKKYLKLNPEATVETFQLGMAHFDSGEKEEALSIWTDVLNKDPINPPALFYKGLVQAQIGRVADARQSLETLLKSAAADNLYFSRAKDLLQAINNGQPQQGGNGGTAESVGKVLPKDAYQVEH